MYTMLMLKLDGYEAMRDEVTGIQQSCFSRIYESDGLIPQELYERLKAAVKALEDVPEGHKDWRPGSNGQVIDLIHPSFYPIVYERTLRCSKPSEGKDLGIADFKPMRLLELDGSVGQASSFSERFA
ncbi:hypothetical protein FRB90_008875 [Tulasnella sp. 427]|nr:hypothetical protein FRB90_008875 [Tulasnella sp. 427]